MIKKSVLFLFVLTCQSSLYSMDQLGILLVNGEPSMLSSYEYDADYYGADQEQGLSDYYGQDAIGQEDEHYLWIDERPESPSHLNVLSSAINDFSSTDSLSPISYWDLLRIWANPQVHKCGLSN